MPASSDFTHDLDLTSDELLALLTLAADLKPGETRTFKIKNMVAGKYVLLSNIAKQYGMGMRAAFTVR